MFGWNGIFFKPADLRQADAALMALTRIPNTLSLENLELILPRIVDEGLGEGNEFLVTDLTAEERTPQLIALLIWHGFMPMAGHGMLLPKIHLERCIMAPQQVHIGRKVRRRAKGFHLTVDQAWPQVVEHIQDLTYTSEPGDCWLSNELAQAYLQVGSVKSQWRRGGVAFHSVELWHTASGELVAGEIGYVCGRVYSSCTGFTKKEQFPGTGSVQLAALGCWLARSGFAIWDLGMDLKYKSELGGRLVPRKEWAEHIRRLRTEEVDLSSPPEDAAEAHKLLLSADDVEGSAKMQCEMDAPASTGSAGRKWAFWPCYATKTA